MSSPVLPCDACGSPIPDADLETGQAVTLMGKRYCSGCKTEAMQSVSLEELSGNPAPAARKKPATASKPAPPARSAPPKAAAKPVEEKPAPSASRLKRETPGRRAPAAAAPSKTPLIAAVAGVVVIVGAVAGYLATRAPEEPAKTGPKDPVVAVPKAGGAGPSDAEGQARTAYLQVEELSRKGGVSWDLVLAAAEKATPACKGTAFEKKLEDLRARARREKEGEESARELAPLVDELKGAVSTDPEFKRFSELQPKFLLAIETAAKSGSPRVTEIRALQNDYNSRYEKVAEPYYTEIHEAATTLASEKRYDDAIRKIDTFPQQFRNSGLWTTLQKLRADIERKKKK